VAACGGEVKEKLHSVKLIKVNRKSQILKPSVFGCLKDTPSINITKGCMHSCVYCYARGFTDAPPKGEVYLYQNLPERLEKELDRKKKLPVWVSFSTASDAFQNMDEILDITYRTMKLLLERGIGISFLTKGFVPSDFIELFKRYTDFHADSPSPSPSHQGREEKEERFYQERGNTPLRPSQEGKYSPRPLWERVRVRSISKTAVQAKVGLVSLSEDYRKLFEPYTASPFQRLLNIRNLINAGVDVAVRIDPIIPLTPLYPPLLRGELKGGKGAFLEESMESLIKRLRAAGVKHISISALVMRPSIMNFFFELPSNIAQNILKHYLGQPWQSVITSAKTRLLPKNLRIAQYSRIKRIARQYGINCKICGCKNPDLPWEFCSPWVNEREIFSNTNKKQLAFFN
jgi:DNA repair photolyase